MNESVYVDKKWEKEGKKLISILKMGKKSLVFILINNKIWIYYWSSHFIFIFSIS